LYMTSFFICILGSKSFCTKLLLHLQEAMMMRFKATLHHAQSLLIVSHQTQALIYVSFTSATFLLPRSPRTSYRNVSYRYTIPTVLIDLAVVTTAQTRTAFPPTSKVTTPNISLTTSVAPPIRPHIISSLTSPLTCSGPNHGRRPEYYYPCF
jgi:hypothetical protein